MRSSLTTQPISIMTCTTTLVSLYYPPPPLPHTHTHTFIANPSTHTHMLLYTCLQLRTSSVLSSLSIERCFVCLMSPTMLEGKCTIYTHHLVNHVGRSVCILVSWFICFPMWPQVEQRPGERAAEVGWITTSINHHLTECNVSFYFLLFPQLLLPPSHLPPPPSKTTWVARQQMV